jgi:hypothetical protein
MRDALKMLGYNVIGPVGVNDPEIALKLDNLLDEISEKYDAFQDNPWPLVYPRMDARHPGSKFILTVRDPDKWFESAAEHFGVQETPMRQFIYGVGHPRDNKEIYIERFKRHNDEVLEYFSNRPNDLLVIDLSKDGAWPKLCSFLGEAVPQLPFPHANRRVDRERRNRKGLFERVKGRIERTLGLRKRPAPTD